MRKYLLTILTLFFLTSISFAQSKPIIGTWQGTLDVGVSLRLVFHIEETPDHLLKTTADSPDQSVVGIKCDTTIMNGDSIRIEMHGANAFFTGKLISESIIDGNFTQLGRTVVLVLKKGEPTPAVTKRPQTPVPPFPYKSENVEYDNADKSLHYGATITIPEGKGPFPAALLITGSGPQDRDETIFAHKPFAVIADALTRSGYIVLRVDDRGFGKSTGNFSESTTADFAEDANTSFDYLLSRSEVNKKKAGLIGHSEGGMIAPMLGSKRKDVDFIILLAGPGIKIDSLMIEQNNAVLKSNGISEAAVAAYQPLFKELMKEAITPDKSVIESMMIHSIQQWKLHTDSLLTIELAFDTQKSDKELAQSLMKQFSGTWFRYFLAFDPQPYLQSLHCKVLALNGSKDIQVISASNLAGIRAAFKKSKLKNYTVKELPGLNHLFQTCTACTVDEYVKLEETFSPQAIQQMIVWLNNNVK
jgi:pimeloyl-ACP methyl ester carboxylesterase